MRKLLWFTIGFGLACTFCAYLHIPLALPMILTLIIGGLFLFTGKTVAWQAAALMTLGFCLGIFWFSRFQKHMLEPLFPLDGTVQEAQIRCTQYGELTDYGIRAEGKIQIGEQEHSVLMYLDEDIQAEPGFVISGPFRIQVTAPGGQKDSSYYQGDGIFLLAYQQEELSVSPGQVSWQDKPAILRRSIDGILKLVLPEDVSSFACALLLGDTSGLDYDVLTDLTVSGIRHIVAVSGLHISVLFGLLSILTFRKRFLSAAVILPVLALFAAVTGFTPSVSRACIMCALMLTATVINREYDGLTALAFSGLMLLLKNPLTIVSVGYQLSFASVAGIYLIAPPLQKWMRSLLCRKKEKKLRYMLGQWVSASVSVTLGATVATVPLSALYFGVISLASVITNLLVLWVVSMIFYGLIALCLLGFLWDTGACFLGSLLAVLIRFVLFAADLIAGFPLAAVYTRSPYIVAWLIFVYLLLVVFCLVKKKHMAELFCCITIGLCAALLVSWTEQRPDSVNFTVLDVGQGQCLLLQTEGRTYMVDCGGSSDAEAADAAAEALLSQGITKLDVLILTHYDKDHSGAVDELLSRVDAELLILPPVYSELQLPAKQTVYATQDLTITTQKMKTEIYAPVIPEGGNENSLCILFDTEKCDILITGDCNTFAERMLLRRVNLPDVDILVAGHHGSGGSTSEELLSQVRPEIVCISAGQNNRYGHPASELLQRLEHYGCNIYRTDIHGDIMVRR